MKTNIKALELIEKGLSSNTVSKLTESQINLLHKKLFAEQAQPQVINKTVKQIVLPSGSQTTVGGVSVSNVGGKTTVTPTTEGEIDEDETDDVTDNSALGADAMSLYTKQRAPHMANDMAPDGMDDDSDDDREMMGMSEDKKYDKVNPWAICHAQVGPKKTRKFERCVMAVKKQLEEGKNPVSLFLENQITKIVEKHIPPRITKGDLIKYIAESSPAPTTKPAPTKPDVKPTKRPSHPAKNPNPGEKPAPKAKKGETKEAAPAPTTKPAPTKPTVKPGTRPRPSHPGKNPNPGENPAPKARKISAEDAKEKVIDTIMNLLQK